MKRKEVNGNGNESISVLLKPTDIMAADVVLKFIRIDQGIYMSRSEWISWAMKLMHLFVFDWTQIYDFADFEEQASLQMKQKRRAR